MGQQVEEILTGHIGGRVKGVRLADGSEIHAPIVISNATHHVTFKNLIKDQSVIPD